LHCIVSYFRIGLEGGGIGIQNDGDEEEGDDDDLLFNAKYY